MYGLEACPLVKSDLFSLDFVVNRFFMKLFKTNNIDVLKLVNSTSISRCQAKGNNYSISGKMGRNAINGKISRCQAKGNNYSISGKMGRTRNLWENNAIMLEFCSGAP